MHVNIRGKVIIMSVWGQGLGMWFSWLNTCLDSWAQSTVPHKTGIGTQVCNLSIREIDTGLDGVQSHL